MVSPRAIDHVHQLYIKRDHIVFDLVPPAFSTYLEQCYHQLGRPSVGRQSAWTIYRALLDLVRQCNGIPRVLMAMEEYNIPDDELLLVPGLRDLHEVDGYMGGVAYGLGLRKFPGINCVYLSYFKFHIRSQAYTSNGWIRR